MLEALIDGTTDPAEVLAELARGRLRSKIPALKEALEGRFSSHHALMVGRILSHIDYLDESIGELSTEIERGNAPLSPMKWSSLTPSRASTAGRRRF